MANTDIKTEIAVRLETIAKLQAAISKKAEELAKTPKATWAHVGSLGYVVDRMTEMAASLGCLPEDLQK